MASLGIKEAFSQYKATLKNVQWSVSAWAPDKSLVVSLWEHHCRASLPGTLEFSGSANRWQGHGNREFRENVEVAFESKADIRLVVVQTKEVERVEAGEDAGKIKKDFFVREDLVGKVIEWDGENYAFQFIRPAISVKPAV
jgi:hypothetical protein